MLLIFAGLPGTGKTTIARELARQIGALHVRIDSIEQAIRDADAVRPVNDAGYRVAYAVAEDNLRLGRTVIADSVNPIDITRNAWIEVAKKASVTWMEIEITCLDLSEHRRRIETRASDIPGLRLPSWAEVLSREYHPWNREHLLIDTAISSVSEGVAAIRQKLANTGRGEFL